MGGDTGATDRQEGNSMARIEIVIPADIFP